MSNQKPLFPSDAGAKCTIRYRIECKFVAIDNWQIFGVLVAIGLLSGTLPAAVNISAFLAFLLYKLLNRTVIHETSGD